MKTIDMPDLPFLESVASGHEKPDAATKPLRMAAVLPIATAIILGIICWGMMVLRADGSGSDLWTVVKASGVRTLIVIAALAICAWFLGRSLDANGGGRPPEDIYWKTDPEGLTIGDNAGGRRMIPWADVRSAGIQIKNAPYAIKLGDYEYSYLVNTRQERIAAKCEDLSLCASIWQHLRRHGKAEAPSALPPEVRRMWEQTPGKIVWAGARTKHHVAILVLATLGVGLVYVAITEGFRHPLQYLSSVLMILLWGPGIVITMLRTADRVDCYDDHFDARLIGKTVSVRWDQVKSISWSTTPPTATSDRCLSITTDANQNVLIPLRPKQEVSVALIYRMVVRLRSLGHSISTP